MNQKNFKMITAGGMMMAALLPPAATACDFCAVYTAQEAQNGGQGVFAGVAEQFTHFGTLLNNGQTESANGEYIDSSVTQLYLGYNFNSRIGVQFNLPVIYREFSSGTITDTEAGVGDASLTGNLRLWQGQIHEVTVRWTVLGGIKLPTGDSARLGQDDFAPGIGGHDLALGSGSFDGIVGTAISARWKRLFVNGQMQYSIRTEGDFQHQYANDWSWSGGVGAYVVLRDDYSLALQFTTSGETKGKDTFAGVADDDSAETIVYLGPEINMTWGENFSAHVGVDLPVATANSGEQLLPDYRLHAALTWRF